MCTRKELVERWPTYGHFWREAHENQHFPDLDAVEKYFTQGSERIVVRTSVSNLRFLRKRGTEDKILVDLYLVENKGWRIGTCEIPQDVAKDEVRFTQSGAAAGTYFVLALSVADPRVTYKNFLIRDLLRWDEELKTTSIVSLSLILKQAR